MSKPIIKSAPAYTATIFIGGDYYRGKHLCQSFCDDVGLCVTVTSTAYVYAGGEEMGLAIGLINYPRFPCSPAELEEKALRLANVLREGLGQKSFTIQTPTQATFYSWREADREPEQDRNQAKALSLADAGKGVGRG